MDKPRKQNSGVKKRSPNACIRCRQQKIKCTGTFPCSPCSKRKLACSFDDSTKKVLVTKGYIDELERRLDRVQSGPSGLNHFPHSIPASPQSGHAVLQDDVGEWLGAIDETALPEPSSPSSHHDAGGRNRSSVSPGAQLMNPLTLDSGNYMADTFGRPFLLGPSSNWSFGRRVLRMTCDRLGLQIPTESLHFEGCVYNLDWQALKATPKPHTYTLPSSDYAIYLINAVKFRCGQIFHLFDETDFMKHFSTLHESPQGSEKVPHLWFIHYLLVIALGKAFVARSVQGRTPPGVELFLEAMRKLPEITFFFADSKEPIEILICAALYLQSLDFRGSAYNLIGQALRKALENGMHTKMLSQHLTESMVDRCRQMWWTIYMLDRQMSSLMGLPQAIRDEDISAPLPSFPKSSQKAIGLELHVKLSRIIANILNTIYSTEGRLARRYLASTKEALRSIATVTDLLKIHIELPNIQSSAGISRLAAHLHLLHYQCICLTTRPLVYSFLERRLKNSSIDVESHTHANTNARRVRPTGSVRALMKTCIEAAQQMLHILTTLQKQGLLESFLPFDLESAFISAIILTMSAAIDRSLLDDHGHWSEMAFSILDDMASQGNMIAAFRKSELQQLISVLSFLPPPPTSNLNTEHGPADAGADADAIHPSVHETSIYPAHVAEIEGPHTGADELPMWQDELTAHQLTLIADTLELDGLDWMTTSLGDSSTHSQLL